MSVESMCCQCAVGAGPSSTQMVDTPDIKWTLFFNQESIISKLRGKLIYLKYVYLTKPILGWNYLRAHYLAYMYNLKRGKIILILFLILYE